MMTNDELVAFIVEYYDSCVTDQPKWTNHEQKIRSILISHSWLREKNRKQSEALSNTTPFGRRLVLRILNKENT